MDKGAVPQDASPTYGGLRKLLYAVDERGQYTGVPSSGWEVESFSTELAVAELERLREQALRRVRAGISSALEYHMFARRMDFDTLASVSGMWRWRLRRHLRPAVFARLPERILRRYADAMGLAVAELRAPPAP
jgi:nucleotide-binding universal stress UspA family protein